MSVTVRCRRWGKVEMPDDADCREFVAFGNANRLTPYAELRREWVEVRKRPMPWKMGLELLAADGGAWHQSRAERKSEAGRKSVANAKARGYVHNPGVRTMLTPAQVKERVQAGGFTSEHGPQPPPAQEKRPALDPRDTAAACRRYVSEWRRVRRNDRAWTLEAYQAQNAAARGKAAANQAAGREYRERKAVGA